MTASAPAFLPGYIEYWRQESDDAEIPNSRWSRTYEDLGEGQGVQLWQVLPDLDDTYIAIGSDARRESTGHHRWAVLTKLDSEGSIVWRRSFEDKLDKTKTEDSVAASDQTHDRDDGVQNDINDLVRAHDEGYVFCGQADESQEINNPRHWLGKVNAEGTLQWETEFRTGLWSDYLESIIKVPDGGYVATGYRAKENTISTTGVVIKVDADGDVSYIKRVGGTGWAVTDACVAHDEGVVATSRFRTVKLSPDGSIQWEVSTPDTRHSLVRLPDEGYLVAGSADDSGPAVRVTKISTAGEQEFQKETTLDANSLITPDSNTAALVNGEEFVLGGRIYAGNGDQNWVAKFSTSGDMLWERRLQNGRIARVEATDDTYVVSGGTLQDAATFDFIPYLEVVDAPTVETTTPETNAADTPETTTATRDVTETTSEGFGLTAGAVTIGALAGYGLLRSSETED